LDEKYARQQLLPLVIFIEENEFWKAQIEQLQVKPDGEIIMAPLVGDQLIEFGDAKNYRQKLQNLKALYEQAFPKTGWDYYSKINVKYTNQVVCTKK
jgi:cell division protein FtsQ